MSIVEWMIQMVFTTEGFVELAIESWPEWDLYIYIYIYTYIYIYIYMVWHCTLLKAKT